MQEDEFKSADNIADVKSKVRISATLDTTGRLCPDLILDVDKAIQTLKIGEVMEILSTDTATKSCVPVWCKDTGHTLLSMSFNTEDYKYCYLVKRVRTIF